MLKRKYIACVLLVFGIFQALYAQTDSCYSVRLVKQGRHLKERQKNYIYNSHGFRLYKNCVYDYSLRSGERYEAQLLDIRKDTLVFQTYFSKTVAGRYGKKLDTLYLHFSELENIYLYNTELYYTRRIDLNKHDFQFFKDTSDCELPIVTKKAHPGDTNQYLVYPSLLDWSIIGLYENNGRVYYHLYSKVSDATDEKAADTVYRKKAVWFIPPMETNVDEINVAIGFIALPSNKRDSLKIKGLCIELFPTGIFAPVFGSFLGSDDVVFDTFLEPGTVTLEGVTLSAGGILMEAEKISGFYVGGFVTIVNKLKGFSLTGINTIAAESNGVSVSGLRSQIKKVRGVQVSLFNSCVDLHGVQIGLLNVSQKRTTMFFNWGH